MKELAFAQFRVDFVQEVVLFQGFMLFSLLTYWIFALWKPLQQKLTSSRLDLIWFSLSLIFGFFLFLIFALDWGSEYFLIAFSLGISVGLALTHSTIAACLLMSLLFLRPWELIDKNDYFTILPKLTFSLCIAHVVLIFAAKRSLIPQWNKATLYLGGFAVWTFFSTFVAPDPDQSQFRFFDAFFKAVFLYLMIMNAIEDEQDLKVLQGTMVLTFLGVGLISIYQTVRLSAFVEGGLRLKGIGAFSNSNDIAALMVLVFPFGLFTMLRKGEAFLQRALSAIVVGIVLICIILSQSRGAMMALALAIALYASLSIKSRKLTILVIAAGVLSLPILTKLSSRNEADVSQSSSSRMTYIKTGINMGIRNPLLGVGYESYEENFERYATEILYEWGHRTAHNTWILAFAETGLLGLIFFVMLWYTSAKMAYEVFSTHPEYLVSLVGYTICISFLSHTYLLYPYIIYGLIGVAHRNRFGISQSIHPVVTAVSHA